MTRSGGPARIVIDAHAGGEGIGRVSVKILAAAATATADSGGRRPVWWDNDIKAYRDFKGGAEGKLIRSNAIDPSANEWIWQNEEGEKEPTNYAYNPPFSCTAVDTNPEASANLNLDDVADNAKRASCFVRESLPPFVTKGGRRGRGLGMFFFASVPVVG